MTRQEQWIETNACFLKLQGADILALCVYGEARGEPVDGQVAVLNVIRNRMRRFGRYADKHIMKCGVGKEFHAVILEPWAFSCFNVSDPNRAILKRLANNIYEGEDLPESYKKIKKIVLDFPLYEDTVNGATLYHDKRMKTYPFWSFSDKVRLVKEINNHLFYTEE